MRRHCRRYHEVWRRTNKHSGPVRDGQVLSQRRRQWSHHQHLQGQVGAVYPCRESCLPNRQHERHVCRRCKHGQRCLHIGQPLSRIPSTRRQTLRFFLDLTLFPSPHATGIGKYMNWKTGYTREMGRSVDYIEDGRINSHDGRSCTTRRMIRQSFSKKNLKILKL